MRFRKTILSLILLSVAVVVAAQALVREETFEFRPSPTTDWENQGKTLYAYDLVGREVGSTTFELSPQNGRFIKNAETAREYDQNGNLSYRSYTAWQVLPIYKKAYTSTTTSVYSEFGIVEQHDKYENFLEPEKNETQTIFEYNNLGQFVYREYVNKRNGLIAYGNRQRYYYNSSGCQNGRSSFEFSEDRNDWVRGDSTYFEMDAACNINYSIRISYQPSGFFFTREWRYERLFDSFGREIEVKEFYRDDLNRDYELATTRRTAYGTNGSVESRYFSDGIYTSQTTYLYDEQERITSEITEVQPEPGAPWIIDTEIGRTYNSDGLIIQESYNYDYDSALMEFRFRYSVTSEVNEDNTIISSVYSSIVYREEEGGFIEYRYTTEFDLRCDGVYSSRLETTNDNVGGRQTRVTYNYYDKAPCDRQQSDFETMSVFPNPASDYTILYLNEPIEKGQLRITDNMGRVALLTDLDGANYFPVDLTSYRAGTYILTVIHSRGEASKRISIVR